MKNIVLCLHCIGMVAKTSQINKSDTCHIKPKQSICMVKYHKRQMRKYDFFCNWSELTL